MGRNIQTTATLQAKTKGFVGAAQEAAKINKAASASAKEQLKNTKDVEKELGKMGGQLKELARLQVSLSKKMEGVDKASETYKKLSIRLKEVNEQQNNLQRSTRNVERAFRDQGRAVTATQMARGGFAQGLVQGAVPGAGPFLQRGPGMGQQMVGMAAGRAARGIVGGVARAPFAGLQGIAQAISQIPGIGGAAAAPMMLAAAQAGPALAFRGGVQQAMPYLGTERLQARTRRRVGRAQRGLTEEDIRVEAGFAAQEARAMVPGRASEAQRIAAGGEARRAKIEEMEATRTGRLAEATAERRAAFGKITQPGVTMAGMAKPEAFQFAAQIARIGGGRAMEMPRQFFQAAFAAKTLYGAGPEISGAFMQAGRRGGLVGGGGRAGEAMAETIGQATAIGLEGSEINDFLNIVASGIQDWKRTGIPINAGSITGIARGVGASIGGVRGMAVARGITGAAQGLAMGGPQSAIDMMMLQAVGYRGGGAEAFEQAQIALEQGKFGAGETRQLMERLTTMGGGGARGRLFARGMLKQKGIQIAPSEMQRLEREGIMGFPEAEKLTTGGLVKRAPAALDPAIQRQAMIVNKQIEAGQGMLKSTQDMADTSGNIAKVFSEELSPALSVLTGKVKELSEALPSWIGEIKKMTPAEMAVGYGKRLIDPFGWYTDQ